MKFSITPLKESEDNGKSKVGFVKTKDAYEVTTPYGLYLPANADRSDRTTITALKKYAHCVRKALREDLVKAKLEDNAGGKTNPIAALRIVADFVENGVYREFERENRRADRGKISFNKTVKHITPSAAGHELVYSEFIITRKKISEQSLVALVQANVINHFMSSGGEVLFGNHIRLKTETIPLNESLILKLNRIKANSCNSRKQQLIRWMTDYIKGTLLNKTADGDWLFSIVASTLWEEMVDACFSDQRIRDKTVYGKRQKGFVDGKPAVIGKPTQHDTLYETEDEIIIFDAKMYRSIRSIRDAGILRKQHGYYTAACVKNPGKRIFNVLVLPHDTGGASGFQSDFFYDFDNGDPNDVILVYELEFSTVMDAYYSGKKLIANFRKELYAYIDSEEHKENRAAAWTARSD